MAFISKEYMHALKEAKLLDKSDVSAIVKKTKELGLQDGYGYSNQHIRNAFKGSPIKAELKELILNHFIAKKAGRDVQDRKEIAFAKKLKEAVA